MNNGKNRQGPPPSNASTTTTKNNKVMSTNATSPAASSVIIVSRDEDIARRLASRSYHLPNYGYWRDYMQYLFNNHPVFGICFHNRLHPLGATRRLLILLGSFAYGVAATNGIYLWYVASGRDPGEEVLAVSAGGGEGGEGEEGDGGSSASLTHGALILLTAGSGSHAIFDRFVWVLAVCCARRRIENRRRRDGGGGDGGGSSAGGGGRCPDLGGHIVVLLVVTMMAAATCAALVRVSVSTDGGTELLFGKPTGDEVVDVLDRGDDDVRDYTFLKGYALEFATSLFVYYPLIETILFSGVLGCGGTMPLLGGRPAQVRREMRACGGGGGGGGGGLGGMTTNANATRTMPPPSFTVRQSTTSSASTRPMTNGASLFPSVPWAPPPPRAARTTTDFGSSDRGPSPLPAAPSPPPPPRRRGTSSSSSFPAMPPSPPIPPRTGGIDLGATSASRGRGGGAANYFGTVNATRGNDDVSTIGDPDMGDGAFYPVPSADVTVGESMMSAGDGMYAFGVMGGGRSRLDTLESATERSGSGTTFGDDVTLEAAYRDSLGIVDDDGDGGDDSRVDEGLRRIVVVAPAGRVGIVLDNVTGGLPFVHSVKEDSPLGGIVEVGDFLLSIDEIDCQGMSALDASRVITDRGRRFERTLVLLRRSSVDVEGGFESDPRYASF